MTINGGFSARNGSRFSRLLAAGGIAGLAMSLAPGAAFAASGDTAPKAPLVSDASLQTMCDATAASAVAAKLTSTAVTLGAVQTTNFGSATHFVAAKGTVPAFCQVSGNFVTNAKTGKTAGFLASFPTNWNGKYLQLGCSGHCGQFYVSNPAMPSVIVTAQGYPGQLLEKGYAIFATNEGHTGMGSADWAVKKDGSVDQDAIDDFLYRADVVLADMGKEFTTAFYASAKGAPRGIARSYFNGCSGGGRDAMVAVSYFPEKFDGIIAGSPYDPVGMGIHTTGVDLRLSQSPANRLSASLYGLLDTIVKKQCDGLDGVKDGIIQNPAACNFRPDRDLPVCTGDTPGDTCFTKAQVETVSTLVTATTDEQGNVIQPGYSISELQYPLGIGTLGADLQKIFVHKNDPAFSVAANYSFKAGGPGPVNAFRVVFSAAEVAKVKEEIRLGAGHLMENSARLMNGKTKLMIWHNFSDEKLTPLSSINYYKKLAKKHGGYAKVQEKARLFLLPGTAHCSITGIGPNAFDAMGTMENWVEKGKAPDAIRLSVAAHEFSPGAKPAPALQFPNWTSTMCKFPEMANYSGKGDVKDAANWSCSAKDKRLLQVGETGRQAGLVD
ncbi:tannase/feruloyl esterase family alpha/beta hydrolase [Sphingobium sufflavum]|uniref:tannase/feruloyl esterase family alpha/beta hydrolase n=1 Tax=Sphingobium sufflavum TaxID=1129547 RepID=UPI001F339BE4|nr:tannase/feruloyl esterase family alpha/beta hydrolase [Sphingobium sufflavum]MCE7796495.1 tannase/feruloyl esterase family alpha/beta hydrolase [Sphingobium sufflavum]